MALWVMILRKMASTKWLQLNLWFGLTVCVALFSSMPLYANAILERTLQKELQLMQTERNVYPGYMRVNALPGTIDDRARAAQVVDNLDRYVFGFPERVGLSMHSGYAARSTIMLRVYGADATEQEIRNTNVVGSFRAVSNLERQIRLIDGRMPDAGRSDGVYEALVTQSFLIKLKRDLGEEITGLNRETGEKFRILPVGVIESAAPEAIDAYAPYPLQNYESSFYIPHDVFMRDFVYGGRLQLGGFQYVLALDYTQLKTTGIETFLEQSAYMDRYLANRFSYNADLTIAMLEKIETYEKKRERLGVVLLSLYAPVMMMLAFYLYMTAGLIVERQKTEIAVLRSRGASRLQVLLAYAAEGLMLGAAAWAVGPWLGVLFTKMLGASSGFLTFVDRAALDVELTGGVWAIAASAAFGAALLTLVPAGRAARTSIVDRKRESARLEKTPFWHKTGIDLILIAAAVWLLSDFRRQSADMRELALEAGSLQVDPLLFVMPAVLALGGGLFILRLYPWFIRLVYFLGRRWWPPALYSTLVTISRSSGQYLGIKVFLIMTVATGLFSANAARTIGDNMENKIRYAIGADVVLTSRWENDAPPPMAGGPAPQQTEADAAPPKRVQYTEPPFLPFTEMPGVEAAARVFVKEDARLNAAGGGGVTTYGIETYEFGRTAWMKNGLLDYHLNAYLNLLASDPRGVLISRSVAEEFGVGPGDPIYIGWEGLDSTMLTVFGVVDYWPGWNPLPAPGKQEKPRLVVARLSAIHNRLALEPYEVWLNLEDGAASSAALYEAITEAGYPLTSLQDAGQELIRSKNDPFRLAINGVMTLGFVISMLISFFGFLVFWLLSLSGRTLQFGVLRAMGIPFGQLIGMLASEQLLTTVAAVVIGVIVGNVVSEQFVPLFEMAFNPSEQVPPFEIVRHAGDYAQLYGVVAVMLALGLIVLGWRLARVKIAQALKLGEE
ncbi:ABC-type transport system, involved in lipoprotein release, permease component [Thermobacillus composti KWC4]|uniref:ABC-type transport system, involved in lipoprotein release, permease component n=1 Tax=Thermobacillus composti (strain DSM 18247 / JCM 13945 / KWC4) TaxID=717605 RepID=L0ED01_THECK|nr:FtsX-like permease family protein [Thermobacillus composti]AGA57566.1 ABC-type transport system, involved in lipoprotein release, permease component [Thermobacillus composti KWC4]